MSFDFRLRVHDPRLAAPSARVRSLAAVSGTCLLLQLASVACGEHVIVGLEPVDDPEPPAAEGSPPSRPDDENAADVEAEPESDADDDADLDVDEEDDSEADDVEDDEDEGDPDDGE